MTAISTPDFKPQVHGNGFVQVDLTPTRRLHVWGHPLIPKQKSPSPIHDHKFSFTSRILLGEMINRRFTARPSPADHEDDYVVHQAQIRDREDTILVPTGERVWLQETSRVAYGPGSTYQMKIGELHESIVHELTVTIIEKDPPAPEGGLLMPRVFIPVGVRPDNEFNRYGMMDEAVLWKIISDALLQARIEL